MAIELGIKVEGNPELERIVKLVFRPHSESVSETGKYIIYSGPETLEEITTKLNTVVSEVGVTDGISGYMRPDTNETDLFTTYIFNKTIYYLASLERTYENEFILVSNGEDGICVMMPPESTSADIITKYLKALFIRLSARAGKAMNVAGISIKDISQVLVVSQILGDIIEILKDGNTLIAYVSIGNISMREYAMKLKQYIKIHDPGLFETGHYTFSNTNGNAVIHYMNEIYFIRMIVEDEEDMIFQVIDENMCIDHVRVKLEQSILSNIFMSAIKEFNKTREVKKEGA